MTHRAVGATTTDENDAGVGAEWASVAAIEADLFWRVEARVRMWSGTHERHNAMSPPPFGGEHEKEFLTLAASCVRGTKERSMDVVHRCCGGVDVHKDSVTACVAWADASGKKRHEKRQFSTMTRDLLVS